MTLKWDNNGIPVPVGTTTEQDVEEMWDRWWGGWARPPTEPPADNVTRMPQLRLRYAKAGTIKFFLANNLPIDVEVCGKRLGLEAARVLYWAMFPTISS